MAQPAAHYAAHPSISATTGTGITTGSSAFFTGSQGTLTLRSQSLKGGVKLQTQNKHAVRHPNASHKLGISIWGACKQRVLHPSPRPHAAHQGMQVAMGLYRQPGQYLSFPWSCSGPPRCPGQKPWVQRPAGLTCPPLHNRRPLMSPLPPPLPATSCHQKCASISVRWQTQAQFLTADAGSAAHSPYTAHTAAVTAAAAHLIPPGTSSVRASSA